MRRIMRLSFWCGMAALVGVFVAAGRVRAQDGGYLDEDGDGAARCFLAFWCGPLIGDHEAIVGPSHDADRGPAHGCSGCWNSNGWSTYFRDCHPSDCNPSAPPDEIAAFEAVYAAAYRGDVETVLRLAPMIPTYASVNEDRQAVQIRSCGGAGVLVSLQASPYQLARLETSLAIARVNHVPADAANLMANMP